MINRTGFGKLRQQWRTFGEAEGGNVAVLFGMALIPLVGLIGAAVDYSQANSVRTAMQTAADSTALAISMNAASQSASQIQANADSHYKALFDRTEAKDLKITATYSKNPNSEVLVKAEANVLSRFISVWPFNISQIPVAVNSTTTWGNMRLRVALALDNTGSMASAGKMSALKTATKNLLTQLQSAATNNGDVYVSIIPFAHDVNVGSSNLNASWLDWTEFGYCTNAPGSDSQYETKGKCVNAGGTWKLYADKSSWNGCVSDRGDATGPNPAGAGTGFDQIVGAPNGTPQSKYPAHQDANCPLGMKSLSYDWSSMKSLVDQMQPAGSTNQPLGLVWAWQSLVGGGPLTAPAYDSNYEYRLAIILLSDGLNTEDRWYGNGSNVSSSVDARMYDKNNNGLGTCKNIKDAKINNKYGITIYTIHVNTDGDPTSTLLKNCASASDKFFALTSANQIITVFNQIGTNLTKLRVAK
jgi:Flp pilus assembly protein TadG